MLDIKDENSFHHFKYLGGFLEHLMVPPKLRYFSSSFCNFYPFCLLKVFNSVQSLGHTASEVYPQNYNILVYLDG